MREVAEEDGMDGRKEGGMEWDKGRSLEDEKEDSDE